MSSDYAERKLQEAVAEAGAAPTATRRLVLEWIERDEQLLRALVRPFLAGIIGHAVDRAKIGRASCRERVLNLV